MNPRNSSLKPINLKFFGTESPNGNALCTKAERVFSKSLIYLCKDSPKTAVELSEELCVPIPFVEEELEIQCRDENGSYGTIRKLDSGKYVTNFLIVNYDEFDQANKIYEKYLPEFVNYLKNALYKNKERILSFPYLSSQTDLKLILWSLINRTVWYYQKMINHIIKIKCFPNVTSVSRKFSYAAVAFEDQSSNLFDSYVCDSIDSNEACGYNSVSISNLYGKRLDKHFSCGHNIQNDPELQLTLRSIGGLSLDNLDDAEKEAASKAIRSGYLRKNGNILEPRIIVLEKVNHKDFFDFSFDLIADMDNIVEKTAVELSEFEKLNIPKHLINEYNVYNTLIAGIRFISKVIDACIEEGLLNTPTHRLGPEGVIMIVEKSS